MDGSIETASTTVDPSGLLLLQPMESPVFENRNRASKTVTVKRLSVLPTVSGQFRGAAAATRMRWMGYDGATANNPTVSLTAWVGCAFSRVLVVVDTCPGD